MNKATATVPAIVAIEDPSQLPRYRRAFEAIHDEILSVPEKDFVGITLDIPTSVFTVVGKWPGINALRPQFVQYLPGFDLVRFDKTETYALALMRAQTEYKTATEPPASLTALANSATETRRVLLADLHALISRELLPDSVLDNLQGGSGYKNLVVDIVTMADILKKNAAIIAERTSVKPEEIYAAENLADELGTAIGLREQAPQAATQAVRNRQAAFTLFITTYEEIRAAVGYLRRKDGDADTIAPTLYTGRGPSKKKPTEDPSNKPEARPVVTQPTKPTAATNASATQVVTPDDNGPFMR